MLAHQEVFCNTKTTASSLIFVKSDNMFDCYELTVGIVLSAFDQSEGLQTQVQHPKIKTIKAYRVALPMLLA